MLHHEIYIPFFHVIGSEKLVFGMGGKNMGNYR